MAQELTKEEIVEKIASYAAFTGEVMLLGWDESHSAGMTCKLQLEEPESGVHPLKEFTVRRGQRAGQRFRCIMFEIDDDEKLVDQDKRERIEAVHKGEAVARAAGRLSNNETFHQYLQQEYSEFWEAELARGYSYAEVAASFIRGHCGVQSRRDLDHKAGADDKFRELHSAFVRWREGDKKK